METDTKENESSNYKFIDNPEKEVIDGAVREIGKQAIWSLSSCKPGADFCYMTKMSRIVNLGNGVEQLRDGSLETYWQSDGPQPHLVNIQFRRKVTIKVCYSPLLLYLIIVDIIRIFAFTPTSRRTKATLQTDYLFVLETISTISRKWNRLIIMFYINYKFIYLFIPVIYA